MKSWVCLYLPQEENSSHEEVVTSFSKFTQRSKSISTPTWNGDKFIKLNFIGRDELQEKQDWNPGLAESQNTINSNYLCSKVHNYNNVQSKD